MCVSYVVDDFYVIRVQVAEIGGHRKKTAFNHVRPASPIGIFGTPVKNPGAGWIGDGVRQEF